MPPAVATADLRSITSTTANATNAVGVLHIICITTRGHSEVLTGTQRHTEIAAQRADQHIRLALTRRRPGVRVPQRPPTSLAVVFVDDYQLPAVAHAASFFVTSLGWTLEEVSEADEVHQWAVLRTAQVPDTRPFDYYVDF